MEVGGGIGNQRVPTTYAVHIYTDRPIYRPEQTVFYKISILRHDNDAILSLLPPDTPVMVRIRDARDNNIVQTTTHQTNEFGTLHGEFQIAAGAMLGDYAIEVVLSDQMPISQKMWR